MICLITQLINYVDSYHSEVHDSYILIFLLEDILFRFRDSSIPNSHKLDIGFSTFVDELLIYFEIHA